MVQQKEFAKQEQTWDWSGKKFGFQTGKLALQADGSVVTTMEENVLHIATVMDKKPDADKDFLPLMIDFRDSFSAAGKIGGGAFRRREGRPSENVILYARMTDRALRPMFPKGMVNETVITITPLALDRTQDLGAMSIIGASMSVMAAGIPFDGPVGAARIAYVDGDYVVNPTLEQIEKSTLNLLVAGKKGSINMIESDGNEAPVDVLKKAFALGQSEIDKSCDMQMEFLAKLTIKEKQVTINKPSEAVIAYVQKILTTDKLSGLIGHDKSAFDAKMDECTQDVLEVCADKIAEESDGEFTESRVKMAAFTVMKHFLRDRTLTEKIRLDNRQIDEIRPLYCEVDMLPRVHGSGLFRRGDTQVLTTVTLGAPGEYEISDTMEDEDEKQRYMHHYNFPPFSVGDARGMRGPGRREIGHGKLAEKALEPMLPTQQQFPYTIRAVSDCLESGGSTSQGSICGSTLSLMAAGVPLKQPVAGIAMGLMSQQDDDDNITSYLVLTDVMAQEDFMGDMDFKIAGTKNGITAIQLDVKVKGLTMDIIHETLDRAFAGYNEILDFMLQTISEPRPAVSKYAPKIVVMQIKPEKVKEVIGRGGETINKIIDVCGGTIKIDFEDDGTTFLTDQSQENIDKAIEMIEEITTDLEVGQVYEGDVTRVENYGVFVQLPKGKVGLAHASNLGPIDGDVEGRFKVGENLKVKIKAIDDRGRIQVTRVL